MIRHPNEGDFPQVLELCRRAHAESWFSEFDFNEGKVRAIFDACIFQPDWVAWVSQSALQLTGFFAACAADHFFGTDKYAIDLVSYVAPEARKGLTFKRMVEHYEAWCAHKGVKEIHLGVSSGRNTERTVEFYERLGFGSALVAMRKKCVASVTSPAA